MPVRVNQVTEVQGVADPVTISGQGDQAPGLLASRFGDQSLAALDCPAPAAETVVHRHRWRRRPHLGDRAGQPRRRPGGRRRHRARPGRAGRGRGSARDQRARARTASGWTSAEALPRRNELALHVAVSRGRVAASVLDVIPELGTQPQTEDWLTPVSPSRRCTRPCSASPDGKGEDVLAVANPGEDEARVTLRILTADSAFAPEGVEELAGPARASVRSITLTTALRAGGRGRRPGHRRDRHRAGHRLAPLRSSTATCPTPCPVTATGEADDGPGARGRRGPSCSRTPRASAP